MRLAFLTPLPPAASGIADYSADVLALLATRHEIDVFHHQETVDRDRIPASSSVQPSSTFLDHHRRAPYDVAIYQMGNAPDHAFLYPLLRRVPGLLVLHDLVLHHSRARTFLESPEAMAYARDPTSASLRDAARKTIAQYEAEIAYSYPAQAGRLSEAHLGTVGTLLPYAYPLCRLPVEASRLIAVHNAYMAEAVARETPDADVARVAMPIAPAPVDRAAVAALRRRLGLDPEDFVVGCFGLMTREKRIETVARAVARAAVALPRLRLLLVGSVAGPGHSCPTGSWRSACELAPSSRAASHGTSSPPTWRWRTSSRTSATPRPGRPRPPCCGCWPRGVRRSFPTSSTSRRFPTTRSCAPT